MKIFQDIRKLKIQSGDIVILTPRKDVTQRKLDRIAPTIDELGKQLDCTFVLLETDIDMMWKVMSDGELARLGLQKIAKEERDRMKSLIARDDFQEINIGIWNCERYGHKFIFQIPYALDKKRAAQRSPLIFIDDAKTEVKDFQHGLEVMNQFLVERRFKGEFEVEAEKEKDNGKNEKE